MTDCPDQETLAVPLPRQSRGPDATALTGRELEILALVTQGLSNHLVGRRLGISEKTVKNHLTAIYAKLMVSCRAEAIACAFRWGLVGM